MEALIYQFMAYFFPVEEIPAPILSVFGFCLCLLAFYMMLGFFMALFERFSNAV